jgi:two-component system chemotaxis response regulator CheY
LHSGFDCLEWLKEHDVPDTIILDIQMPEMNGFEVYDRIRENKKTAEIPVIFLSGSSSEQTIKKIGGFFADGFLEKPIHARDLKEIINSILN